MFQKAQIRCMGMCNLFDMCESAKRKRRTELGHSVTQVHACPNLLSTLYRPDLLLQQIVLLAVPIISRTIIRDSWMGSHSDGVTGIVEEGRIDKQGA